MLRGRWTVLLGAPLLLSGCSSFPTACTMEARPGINIRSVTDAVSGSPVVGGLEVIFRDGDFSETVMQDQTPISAVYERAGLYSVTINRSGYQPRTVSARVVDGGCHVRTAQLDVALQPTP